MFILLFSLMAFAECKNFIAESEIPAAISLSPGAGLKKCGERDKCVCFDDIDWETAEYVQGKLQTSPKKAELKKTRLTEIKAKEEAERVAKERLMGKLKNKELTMEEIQELLIKVVR